jgi:5'(3')-deoxyribonucleotidase
MKNKKYHTVGTVPNSRKTKNITLSEQFQNLEKQKLWYCLNSPKSRKTKIITLSEQFQNPIEKYHTVGTVPKSTKTKNIKLSEQFQNLEKQKISHCQNSSKI